MKTIWKVLIPVGIGVLLCGGMILAYILWSINFEKEFAESMKPLPTPTMAVSVNQNNGKEEAEPTKPEEPSKQEVPTKVPEQTEEADEPGSVEDVTPTESIEPTAVPNVAVPTEVPVITDAPVVTDVPNGTEDEGIEPSVTNVPDAEPTKVPTAPSATPTVTPIPVTDQKFVKEYQMGDNVWYRLTEDGTLYVTGTGATVRFNYTYDKATDYIKGGDYHYDYLMEFRKAKHIVIEEGITRLSSWSLMYLADVQSITFPKSLEEIEDFCFLGTGKTVNTVWIGLDKNKVKLGKDAFYGTVYQTEDIQKQHTVNQPTPTPTPVLIPMGAESFYQALVEEAGIQINKNDREPYSTALIRNQILSAVEIGEVGETISNQEAAFILYEAAAALGIQGNSEVIATARKYDRISDKRGVVPDYETAVYFCFGSGIMPGMSDGEYSHTRSFKPKERIGSEEGRMYCRRLFHPEERVPMSPDAQVIRTKNLPIQAKLYPYILESFPNIYYDANYLYMYNLGTDDRAFPDTAKQTKLLETWCTPNTIEEFSKSQPERCKIYTSETDYLGYERVGMDKVVERYRDTWEQQAREYLELVFNFDYRTVREDTEWQNRIKNLNAFYHEWGEGAHEGSCAGIAGIDEWFANFLDYAEENRTIIECSDIDFDMSTLFYSERFHETAPYTIRVHLRYKITTDFEPDFSEMAEVIPVRAYNTWSHFTSFGEWKDVYAELTFATNSFDRTGIGGVRVLEYNTDDAIRYHFDPKKYVK